MYERIMQQYLNKRYAAPLSPKNRRKIILTPLHCPSKMKAGGYRILNGFIKPTQCWKYPLLHLHLTIIRTHESKFEKEFLPYTLELPDITTLAFLFLSLDTSHHLPLLFPALNNVRLETDLH